ncbi:MAG: MDR family MFS transporter [Anaerovoracaceae bacterium]
MEIKSAQASGKNTLIIAVMISGVFLAVLNQTVLSPALPSIMEDLNITANEGQWLTTAFMLVNGIMIPITAYFINRFTTRQIFLSSMILFTAGTAVAGFASNFTILLIARILQAMAAGVLMPMIQTVMLLLFPREKRGTAMGTIGIVIAFAPAVGPSLAGWVVDSWGWNSVFLMIAPMAFIIVVLSFFLLKNVGETTPTKLDVLSVILSTVSFGGLLYGFSIAGTLGWLHPVTVASIILGAVFLFLFIRRQGKLKEPLLELKVLKTKIFSYSTVISMIVNAALIAGGIITPIYLQNVLGFTAMQSGLLMLPGALLMGVMSPITGRLFDRFGPRGISVLGLSILTVFTGAYILMDETWTFIPLCFVYTARMFGLSLVNMPINTWGLNALENKMIAHGSAINNTARQVAGSIGTAVLITIMSIVSIMNQDRGVIDSTLSGMHGAFTAALVLSLAALIMAILFVKREKRDDDIFCD